MKAAILGLLTAILSIGATVNENRYEVGQVWEYENAEPDVGSLVIIQAFETLGSEDNRMEVYHVSLTNIDLGTEDVSQILPHIPVSRETLDKSVVRLTDTSIEQIEFAEGIAIWRRNNGGVFTISLAEIADLVRHSIAQQ